LHLFNRIIEDIEQPGAKYSFALTGTTWTVLREYYPEVLSKVATRGAVFARMSPDHKQQLIQELQTLEYYVGK
jgi:cation-transporting ATPase 13A3/4/5